MDLLSSIIGKYNVVHTAKLAVAGAGEQLVPLDARRWAVLFSSDATMLVSLQLPFVPGGGLTFDAGVVHTLNVRDHASLAQVQLFFQVAPGSNVNVFEIIKIE